MKVSMFSIFNIRILTYHKVFLHHRILEEEAFFEKYNKLNCLKKYILYCIMRSICTRNVCVIYKSKQKYYNMYG